MSFTYDKDVASFLKARAGGGKGRAGQCSITLRTTLARYTNLMEGSTVVSAEVRDRVKRTIKSLLKLGQVLEPKCIRALPYFVDADVWATSKSFHELKALSILDRFKLVDELEIELHREAGETSEKENA